MSNEVIHVDQRQRQWFGVATGGGQQPVAGSAPDLDIEQI
jgi:hypothetical protein